MTGDAAHHRNGSTAVEIVIAAAVFAILAWGTLAAFNPSPAIDAGDGEEDAYGGVATDLQNALSQYRLDNGGYPAPLPEGGTGSALPICRYGVEPGSSSCLSFDDLIPVYFTDIPVDAAERNMDITGYSVFQDANGPVVVRDRAGE